MGTIRDPPSGARGPLLHGTRTARGHSVEDLSSAEEENTRADHKDVDTQATFG